MKKTLLFLPLLLVVAVWVDAAYVIFLRDGTRIVAREKYEVKGPNAVFRTQTGALTSVPLAAVDVGRTDRINAQGLGNAQLLEWVDASKPTPTPVPTKSVAGLGAIRRDIARPEADAARPTPTPSVAFRESKYRDPKVDKAFQHGLESFHLFLFRTSQGTKPEFLFVEVQVNGQPEVLKALQAISTTYHLVAQDLAKNNDSGRLPERVEIQMLNESGKEAGVFRIAPTDAAELATGKTTAEAFFVKHVIF